MSLQGGQMNTCPLCEKRVSEWMMACGKTVVINGRICHKTCVMDYDISPSELEAKIKKAS